MNLLKAMLLCQLSCFFHVQESTDFNSSIHQSFGSCKTFVQSQITDYYKMVDASRCCPINQSGTERAAAKIISIKIIEIANFSTMQLLLLSKIVSTCTDYIEEQSCQSSMFIYCKTFLFCLL